MVMADHNGVFPKDSEYEPFKPYGDDMEIVPTPIDDNVTDTIIYSSFMDFGAEVFLAAKRIVKSVEHKFCGSIEDELLRKWKEETHEEWMWTRSRLQEQIRENECTNICKNKNSGLMKRLTLDDEESIDTFVVKSIASFGDDLIDKIGDKFLCSDDAMVLDNAVTSLSSCHTIEDLQEYLSDDENEEEIKKSSIFFEEEMKDIHNFESSLGIEEKSEYITSDKKNNSAILISNNSGSRRKIIPDNDQSFDSNFDVKKSSLFHTERDTKNFRLHSQIPHIPFKKTFHLQKSNNIKLNIRTIKPQSVTRVQRTISRYGKTWKLEKPNKSKVLNNKTYKQKRVELWLKQNKTEKMMDAFRPRSNVLVA